MASKGLVLVTGGTGYLAGWVIALLMERGYRVRTSVRSEAGAARIEAEFRGDDVHITRANLLSDAGWANAMGGVRFVIHTATPMLATGTELLTAARDGTLRVLRAARQAGVERVVMTSSGFAAQRPLSRKETVSRIDESVWTDPDANGVNEYAQVKTLTERAAWTFSEESGLELVTILPGFILGPVRAGVTSPSMELIRRMLKGAMPAVPNIGMSVVDVRDVALMHILAMENPSAAGERFLAAGDFTWFRDIARILSAELGPAGAKVPRRTMPDLLFRTLAVFNGQMRQLAPMLGRERLVDHSKATRLLAWTPRPLRETIVDGGRSLMGEGRTGDDPSN